MHLLAACACMEVARNKERLIDDDNNEKTERQTAMQQIPEYQYAMNNGLLDSFDIHILDKMEGVLKRDLSNTRRYASLTDIVALLKHFRLTCILLQAHKWKDHLRWQIFLPDITNENTTNNIQPCLLYTSPSPRDRQKSRMPSSA